MVKKVKVFSYILFAMLFSSTLMFTPLSHAQLTENLRVRIYLVETSSNGTLTSTPIDNVQVTVTYLETGQIYTSYTADGGWARFWLNYTGQYNLTSALLDYICIPKYFYIDDINKTTIVYDNIYKLAKFFAGDQMTIFQTIQVELPSTIVLKIPKFTNFTSHIDAYGGLKFDQLKLDDRYVFTPYDFTTPHFTKEGEIFYPNYTVTANFMTSEDGTIGLMIGSNASYIVSADPLYLVPKGVWVKISYVVYTYEKPEVAEMSKIEVMLEQILNLLLQIRDMINNTVIPKLQGLYNFSQSLFDKTFGNIDFQQQYDKLKEVDTNVKMVRDTLMMFTNGFKDEIRTLFTEQVGDIRTLIYLFGGIAVIVAVVIGFGKRKTSVKQKSERNVIVK